MADQVTRKPYVREVPRVRWILRHPRYLRYMAREFTCLFIAAYTFLLVVGLKRLSEGREAYDAFLAALATPFSVAFHVVALGFAIYHSATWFNLTPKALPVQIGESFAPPWSISAAHYAAWALLSLLVLSLAGVG